MSSDARQRFAVLGLGRYNITVIAIRHGNETLVTPPPTYRFAEGDNIFIIGKESSLAELEKAF